MKEANVVQKGGRQMRKLLVLTLVGALVCAALPGAALAGDRHAGSALAAGLVLGATAAVVGGVLANTFAPPVLAPPVAYAPPPIVYAPAPPVVYVAPPIVYRSAPVVIHRHAAPGYWYHARHERGRAWNRH
jgi:hypothetical protein